MSAAVYTAIEFYETSIVITQAKVLGMFPINILSTQVTASTWKITPLHVI